VHRFDGLGDHYVRKDIHIRDIAEVHARQDNYQRQTDVLITDVEDELRAQSKAAADASAQRHQDRITLVGIAVAAVVAVVVAFIPVLFP
jgi:type VI protein secretion system component VasF